jgi:hypothetical protein
MFKFFVISASAETLEAAAKASQEMFLLKLAVAVVVATATPAPINSKSRTAYPELVATDDPEASRIFDRSLAALTVAAASADTAITFVSSAEADVAAVATEVSDCSGFIKLAVEVVVATALPAPLNKRSRTAYP